MNTINNPKRRASDKNPLRETYLQERVNRLESDIQALRASRRTAVVENTVLRAAAQQARKPLSNEEFQKICTRLSRQGGWDGDGWDLALKEAIEEAHDIKGGAA